MSPSACGLTDTSHTLMQRH